MNQPQQIFHYTIKHRLELILKDKLIKPATAHLAKNEKPVVWCSANTEWEETANKSYPDSLGNICHGNKLTTHKLGGGLARISVKTTVAPYRWNDFKKLSGVPANTAKSLYDIAIMARARPGEWYVSFEPIPDNFWLSIELFDGSQWKPV